MTISFVTAAYCALASGSTRIPPAIVFALAPEPIGWNATIVCASPKATATSPSTLAAGWSERAMRICRAPKSVQITYTNPAASTTICGPVTSPGGETATTPSHVNGPPQQMCDFTTPLRLRRNTIWLCPPPVRSTRTQAT